MKNLTNRTKVALTVLCYLGLTLFMNSCKDDDTPPNCGCKSETRTTIPESANLVGEMFYLKPTASGDDYYTNLFWIVYTEQNCSNCIHHMVVCNEDFLKDEFEDLKDLPNDESIQVKFSGHLKEICEKRFAPGDYTYERITLTSIERQ